ncbi:MAG: peptidylprolyl isomerase [Flavobacteriaceae bacterium]|jgi:peptidyl-prolyl cis-trans isomerase A (cyclophilin A)|nr:peptidylprolyl isomerase [Flavobacteriaceae bacterium]
MKKITIAAMAALLTSCASIDYKKMNIDKQTYDGLSDGLYATLQTSKGNMLVKFEDEKSPVTVANFIGLAEGKIDNKAKAKGIPYYDGTIFHRVIKNFMIQGGDPQGTGMGDPGYKFEDEKNDLLHTGKGILSMANSGPNTNGSQFFITEVATPWLDGKHTIFGKVVRGENVIDEIANVEKGANDKPATDVILEKISVFSKGNQYKDYDPAKTFEDGKAKIQENNKVYLEKAIAEQKKKEAEFAANQQKLADEQKQGMQSTPSGLYYKITKSNPSGKTPVAGNMVSVHYAGRLVDGTEFDNSFKRGEPIQIPIGVGSVIKGWDEGILLLKEGETATLLIPAELGYGERGAGGVIPPNSWLIFDVELVKVDENSSAN